MKKKIISLLVLLTVLFSSISIKTSDAYAADGTVKIFLGDDTTPRHHKAIAEGSRSEELSFELEEGTVKKSSYTSDNPDSFKVLKENGNTYIEGISEGVGYVTLNIETTTGEKYKERLFISVYKGTGTYTGIINAKTDVYRGASVSADVENLDDKGDFSKNTKVDVVATCDNFYLIRTIDGSVFEDDKDTGFVEKKYIDVITKSIEIDDEYIALKENEKVRVTYNVQPSFAKEKSVTWNSKNSKIADVDASGLVKGVSEGNTTIEIKTKDISQITKKINVSVFTGYSESYSGYFKNASVLYKTASKEKIIASEIKGKKVSIVGNCGDYYRIKVDNQEGFAVKNDIFVYVKSITLSKTSLKLAHNKPYTIKCLVKPRFADNVNVEWKTSNNKMAIVNKISNQTEEQKGEIKPANIGKGKFIIGAYAKDGSNVKAECNVELLDLQKPILKVKQKDFKKKQIVLKWNSQKNIDEFRIYKNSKKVETVKNKFKWIDKKVKKNKLYKYYVVACKKADNVNMCNSSDTKQITPGGIKYTNTKKKTKVTWNKIHGASKYIVYKYNKKKKKYVKVSITKKNKYVHNGIKANEKNKYYIVAVDKNGKKISKSKTITTKAGDSQTLCFAGYKNVLVTNKKAGYKKMENYKLPDKTKSLVKYNYSKNNKTLYIHLFINIIDKTNNSRFVLYDKKGKIGKTIDKKYKAIVLGAITKCWSINIKGTDYDFGKGVNFKTKVVLHQGKKSGQKRVNIYIGAQGNKKKIEDNNKYYYWFYASGHRNNDKYQFDKSVDVVIPTQQLLEKNNSSNYSPETSLYHYETVVAHEIGHAMGLNDAYKSDGIVRSLVTDEIGHVVTKDKEAYHVMNNGNRDYAQVYPNDVEMIIQAQKDALANKISSFQSYKTYTDKGNVKYKKSKVIKKVR